MADITMCRDKSCPKRKTCYRFTAPPGHLQSWFMSSPREGDKCSYYMNVNLPEKQESWQEKLKRREKEFDNL